MTCLYCGKEFKQRTKRSKYCNMNCQAQHKSKLQAFINKKPIEKDPRYCIECGAELTGNHRLYCNEVCERKRNAGMIKESLAMKKHPVEKSLKKSDISASEINAVARVKGMSYGKFTGQYITAATGDVVITKHKKWAVFNFGKDEVIATTGRETVVGNHKEIQLHIARKTRKKVEEVVI